MPEHHEASNMKTWLEYLCLLCMVIGGYARSWRTANESAALDLMDSLINKTDNRIRPYIHGPPVRVQCDFYVQNIGSINAVDMDFQVDVFFRVKWKDERFSFAGTEPVIIPSHLIHNFWLPDLFFTNEKDAKIHELVIPNQVIKIFPDGLIRLSTRMTLKLICPMVLKNYPLDYQDCFIRVSSYSYTTDDLIMVWGESNPVEIHDNELYLPQFELIGTNATSCQDDLKTGTFPCLMVLFHFKRLFGYYLLQAYVPSLLIVILSWVSFWVHKEAVPARITLGVTTVLTMTTQLTNSRSNSINVSYAKAIDVWYAICMGFVFGALVEYAFVNSYTRFENRKVTRKGSKKNIVVDLNSLEGHNSESEIHTIKRTRKGPWDSLFRIRNGKCTSDSIDRLARVLFPLLFIAFNFIYWFYYTQKIVYTTEK